MKFRLIPTDEGFFTLFEQSAANAAACARHLQLLLGNPSNREAYDAVVNCEREGDAIAAALLQRLNTSFVTPFDREDIHALTEEFDDIVDDMQAVAQRIDLLRVTTIIPEIERQAGVLVQLSDEASAMAGKLESMKGITEHLQAIDRLESEADRIYHEALARLFSGEFEALDVIRWKDLVESMEAAINTFEDISDVVESIVLKHA